MAGFSDLDPKNYITGATDGTNIGNVGDRLKVDAKLNNSAGVLSYTSYRVASITEDSEFALSPTGVSIYSFNGSGKFESFEIEVENNSTTFEFYLDGVKHWELDMKSLDDAGINDKPVNGPFSISGGSKVISFYPRFPIKFDSSFEIKGKQAGSKKIKQYIITYVED